MGKTSIEWCDWSINPIRARAGVGNGHYCEKVSPGCKNCYSSRLQPRFRMPQFQEQRGDPPDVYLHAPALEQVLRRRKPTRIFWEDMSDLFGEWVPNEWIAACFGVMAATPQHTHLVLTKRAERMPEWFGWIENRGPLAAVGECLKETTTALDDDAWRKHPVRADWPLPNVWLGVSVEDQQRADERIPYLQQTPAAVRFVSAEPLLGPVGLWAFLDSPLRNKSLDALRANEPHPIPRIPGLDWVIVGGESGHGARPFNTTWGDVILRQCRDAGIACFIKQLGAKPFTPVWGDDSVEWLKLRDRKGGDPAEWPADLRVREFPEVRT